jgi:hypothetical protein
LLLALSAAIARRADANGPASSAGVATTRQVQELVDMLRLSLAVKHDVTVEVVDANPLKASVAPVTGAGTFRLSIEQRFLDQLTADELNAVLAHELGHVWIYTHFPYLQTEQLANEVALRIVTRQSLDQVYGKVWADAGASRPAPRLTDERGSPATP